MTESDAASGQPQQDGGSPAAAPGATPSRRAVLGWGGAGLALGAAAAGGAAAA
ncbi:deferrochelatase/peroxidase EfeB, partial [Streptomyces sp. WAC05950]